MKPLSPFEQFVKMCCDEHRRKYPTEDVQMQEISRKCKDKWEAMTDQERRRFLELSQRDAFQLEVAAGCSAALTGGSRAVAEPKKKKQKKDPNAPKRAMTAFFFFSHEKRAEVAGAHPEWRVAQVAQELGRLWRELTQEAKLGYEQSAAQDRQRYESEMIDFKAGRPVASVLARQAEAQARKGASRSAAVAYESSALASLKQQVEDGDGKGLSTVSLANGSASLDHPQPEQHMMDSVVHGPPAEYQQQVQPYPVCQPQESQQGYAELFANGVASVAPIADSHCQPETTTWDEIAQVQYDGTELVDGYGTVCQAEEYKGDILGNSCDAPAASNTAEHDGVKPDTDKEEFNEEEGSE